LKVGGNKRSSCVFGLSCAPSGSGALGTSTVFFPLAFNARKRLLRLSMRLIKILAEIKNLQSY
jgi:hypothetical protein